jgi:glycosyltransferase involved in cell wall biosynthesis
VTVRRIVVVIPARNEEQLVERSLRSVLAASERVLAATGRAHRTVHIVLVADACTDRTAQVARSVPGVEVVETPFGNVGAARAAGIRYALSLANSPAEETWIANTDADSVVPPEWLTLQLGLANAGTQLMVGTVRPLLDDLSPDLAAAWRETHEDGRALGHVHGANLGILASTYLAIGGFAELREHEDVALVASARALGATVVESARCEVETSGRLRGRTPGGYAAHLATLI